MSGGGPVPVPVPEEAILCIADLEKAASKKLPASAREFFNSGSTDEITIRENSSAFLKYRVRPRVLVDVARADPSTSVFGRKVSFPLGVAPAGLQAVAHPDGESGTSRACARRGINMAISSFSNHSVRAVREAGLSAGPIAHAMQMYTMKDRGRELGMIREAEAQGCAAVLLTADSPVLGVRYNERRNDFRTPAGLGFPAMGWSSEQIRAGTHGSWFADFTDDAHSWAREVPWLRSVTGMEIWIKGVLTAEDTLKAVEMGCDGIIVSNHGGRQLDCVPATIDALPECVAAANGRIKIHLDGGIPYDGEKGVDVMLETLYNEFKRCMQLTGCNSVKDITKACLGLVRPDGPLARL